MRKHVLKKHFYIFLLRVYSTSTLEKFKEKHSHRRQREKYCLDDFDVLSFIIAGKVSSFGIGYLGAVLHKSWQKWCKIAGIYT